MDERSAKHDGEVAPNEPRTTSDEAAHKTTESTGSNNTTPPKPNSEPRRVGWLKHVFLALLIGVIGFGGGWLGAQSYQNEQQTATDTQRVVLDSQGDLISSIAKEVGQSVVSVNVTSRTGGGFGFFGPQEGVEQQSAGTGIILNKEGLIVTNRHVVPEEATEVSVVLSDGTEFEDVEVVGRTNENDPLDIAFLQIRDLEDRNLTPATIGDSNNMRVGDSVIAIGNALGQFQNTVTTGVLSAYGRSVVAGSGTGQAESLEDLFQTDAAINQGNSGGPLVNVDGEVIGINTAVADAAENIGFAIPVNNIKGLIKSVEQTGELRRAFMGVVYVPVNSEVRQEFDLSVENGAFIPPSDDFGQDTVVDDSPAEEAGIQEGDVITKIDDKDITDQTGLASVLGQYAAGETITVTVDRNGDTRTMELTLAVAPED